MYLIVVQATETEVNGTTADLYGMANDLVKMVLHSEQF